MMADNLQITQTSANEIYDIEPLVVPGVDWLFWLESLGWGLAGLLILVAVLYFGSRWYRPLVFKWQLKALSKKITVSEQSVAKSEIWKLYAWLKQFNHWLESSEKPQNISFESDLDRLMQQVNQAGFSKQTVSRETYLDLIQQAQALLKKRSVLLNLKTSNLQTKIEEQRWKQ